MRKRGRPRKYQENIRCPECDSNWFKKFGKTQENRDTNGDCSYNCVNFTIA